MSKDIKIRKGLNIRLQGEAEKTLSKAPRSRTFAIRPKDFHLVTPKMVIKEGTRLQAGDTIFYSKANESIKFVSPVSGTLTRIERGAKRVITRLVIEVPEGATWRARQSGRKVTLLVPVFTLALASVGCQAWLQPVRGPEVVHNYQPSDLPVLPDVGRWSY